MTTINFTVLPPPQELSRDIECVRIATHTGHLPLEVKVCPSGYPGIVFQLAVDQTAALESIAIRSAKALDIPILFLHGQGSEPSIMRFRDIPFTTIQVVFKPYALYSLFGWDTSNFNQSLLIPDQFGAVDLEKQLMSVNSIEEQVSLIHYFLIAKMNQTHKRDELIELTLDYIRDHISSISVKELVTEFHISERQFQKRFTRVVGMAPNLFIRVRRVNEALKLMHSGQYERLSDVAYALNYCDQSHFIRDMKAFSWVSPKHIAMKVREFHTDLAGSSYL
ncbi:AraC family transcriptional regulator [Paenibacillus psychroresistens]|uniref:AraC family transcriptional regulator n=1 Tax=Paenibacillus psychroresistens TaxID=1778678 RepID=A0A6B8RMM4_9BACL|nr:AraC family transcriptional regulator [Paenibacillus psychroresistens]QGQ97540.1 AraC family transcriptional regulator [Paenibacillus psychroresistens]